MAGARSLLQYAELNATKELLAVYATRDLDALHRFVSGVLLGLSASARLLDDFSIESVPTRDFSPRILDGEGRIVPAEKLPVPASERLIIVFGFDDPLALGEFRRVVFENPLPVPPGDKNGFLGVGAELGASLADHWCPGAGGRAAFGRQRDARAQIRADALSAANLRGRNVNVLVVDQGLSSAHLPPGRYGGGIDVGGVLHGSARHDAHGMMVARAILDVAPEARLFDVPAVPGRIGSVLFDISTINSVYLYLLGVVAVLREFQWPIGSGNRPWSGPWMLVNAWAVFDRREEVPRGDYTANEHPFGHPFNHAVALAAGAFAMDVVFAAGNAGQYCPDRRAGPLDRGPGHSIWGANAHAGSVTAGAVRTDDLWLGMSSQGPGPANLAPEKPDLVAPSQFRDDDNAAWRYSGTSGSCAVTAGVVAALRSNPAWGQAAVAPAAMRQALMDSARKIRGPQRNGRLGHGVLDARGAMQALEALRKSAKPH